MHEIIIDRDANSLVTTGHNKFLPVQLSIRFQSKTNRLTYIKKTDKNLSVKYSKKNILFQLRIH